MVNNQCDPAGANECAERLERMTRERDDLRWKAARRPRLVLSPAVEASARDARPELGLGRVVEASTGPRSGVLLDAASTVEVIWPVLPRVLRMESACPMVLNAASSFGVRTERPPVVLRLETACEVVVEAERAVGRIAGRRRVRCRG